MSRRDLLHVLTALAELAGNAPGVPVAVAAIDEAVGRGRDDMRTPLNLASLQADGLVEPGADGTWSLTAAGAERHREDEDYAGR
jgi:hypothetical protein